MISVRGGGDNKLSYSRPNHSHRVTLIIRPSKLVIAIKIIVYNRIFKYINKHDVLNTVLKVLNAMINGFEVP